MEHRRLPNAELVPGVQDRQSILTGSSLHHLLPEELPLLFPLLTDDTVQPVQRALLTTYLSAKSMASGPS